MVKFFFVIPTLNSSSNLSRLIESFKEQTYQDWRIMFVDGSSTNLNKKKLQEICSVSEKLLMINQNAHEPGIYGAMNEGFKNIKEDEWLFFWGDDDWFYASNTLENLASEINERAKSYLDDQESKNLKIVEDLKTEDKLKNFEGMDIRMVARLAKNNILTLDDFANLSTSELIDKNDGIFKDFDLDEDTANKLIMKARESWFSEENKSDV